MCCASADGEHVWFIDYRKGTQRVNIRTGHCETVWPNGHTHSQCDAGGRYLVGDIAECGDDWRVAFFNIRTGKEIGIVSRFPAYPNPGKSWSLSATTPGV